MPNETLAKEWLVKAWHDLSSARILFDAEHFTDTIAFDLQQAIEKTLKSILAYNDTAIKKTHDLVEITKLIESYIHFSSSELDLLDIATSYYVHDRYPTLHSDLPPRNQIFTILEFAERLFHQVCHLLLIDEEVVKQ